MSPVSELTGPVSSTPNSRNMVNPSSGEAAAGRFCSLPGCGRSGLMVSGTFLASLYIGATPLSIIFMDEA